MVVCISPKRAHAATIRLQIHIFFVAKVFFLVSPNTNETRIYNLFIPYKFVIDFFEFRMRIKQFSFHVVLDERNVYPESSSFVKLL